MRGTDVQQGTVQLRIARVARAGEPSGARQL